MIPGARKTHVMPSTLSVVVAMCAVGVVNELPVSVPGILMCAGAIVLFPHSGCSPETQQGAKPRRRSRVGFARANVGWIGYKV